MSRKDKNLLYFLIGIVLTILFSLIAQFIYIQSFVQQVNNMFKDVSGLDDWVKYNINDFKKNLSEAFTKVDKVNYQFYLINKKVDGISLTLVNLIENNTNKIIKKTIDQTESRLLLKLNKLVNKYDNNTRFIYFYIKKTFDEILFLEKRIYSLINNTTNQIISINEQLKKTNTLIQNSNDNICSIPGSIC